MSQPGKLDAPVGGLNKRDPESNMKSKYALVLDNFFPEQGRVRLRKGSITQSSGITGDVETLLAHKAGAVEKLIACAGGFIWDATTPVATKLNSVAGTNNRWQHTSMTGHTILVNGADDPQRILPDGTLATAHGWSGTGLTPSTLESVLSWKARLLFTEKDSANIWYGPVAGVQGELTQFPVDRFYPEGGNIVALGSITLDSGLGVDDLLCIFMSSGPCVGLLGYQYQFSRCFWACRRVQSRSCGW